MKFKNKQNEKLKNPVYVHFMFKNGKWPAFASQSLLATGK